MRTYSDTARQVNQKFSAGQSQFKPRPKHPFLTATWEQFRHPSDGRKFESRCKLKREICRGYAKLGPDATRTMLARFLHLPEHTVIRGQRYARKSGFVEHIKRVSGSRHRHGYFASDRMMRALHPEMLKPPRESAHTVPCESAHNNSSTSNSKACEAKPRFDTDSRAASAARPCVPPARRTKPYSKPTPEQRPDRFVPRELLLRFAKEFRYSVEEADGRLGWIVKRTEARKKYHNAIGPDVRNVWRYVRAANRSIDARSDEPGQLDWLIASYSFAEMFKLDLCDSFFDSID